MNRRFIGFEIDKGYYELSQRRLREATAQLSLWDLQNIEQETKNENLQGILRGNECPKRR